MIWNKIKKEVKENIYRVRKGKTNIYTYMYSCFISKQFGLLFVWSCSELTLYPPDSNNLPSWKVHYFPYYFFLTFATGADSFQHNHVKCYLNCYSRLKYSVICRVYKMIICNGGNVTTMSKTNRQTKQRSGQGVVMERRCEKSTVSLHCDLYSHNSCVTELTLRGKKTEHRTHIFCQGACFGFMPKRAREEQD